MKTENLKYLLLGVVLVYCLAWTGDTALKFATLERDTTTRAFATGIQQVAPLPLSVVGNAKSYCVGITASDADFTLSTTSDFYQVCAYGNTAYLTFKDTAPGVTTSVNGYDMQVADGQCYFVEIQEALAAVIGTSAAGVVCFYPMTSPGGTPSA